MGGSLLFDNDTCLKAIWTGPDSESAARRGLDEKNDLAAKKESKAAFGRQVQID